jgi:hypothetical protein
LVTYTYLQILSQVQRSACVSSSNIAVIPSNAKQCTHNAPPPLKKKRKKETSNVRGQNINISLLVCIESMDSLWREEVHTTQGHHTRTQRRTDQRVFLKCLTITVLNLGSFWGVSSPRMSTLPAPHV